MQIPLPPVLRLVLAPQLWPLLRLRLVLRLALWTPVSAPQSALVLAPIQPGA